MLLTALYLRNFRNYSEEKVFFVPGINAICGLNAQGKTNLLEAIYLLMTGRSFRTAHLSDLIYFGASFFYLEAHFIKNGISHVLKMHYDGVQRKILFNNTSLPTLSSLLGIVVGVLLSPEDIILIKGNPAIRRHFLDLQIAQGNPLYLYHLSRYVRALKQRNTLLRCKTKETLEIWEGQLAEAGAYIILQRQQATKELQLQGHSLQISLSGSVDQLQLHYKSPSLAHIKDQPHLLPNYLLSQLAKHRPRELEVGVTLYGPHKDDVAVLLQEKEARFFASEGQQRSCIAALRLAEWNRLFLILEEKPIMCIDDIGISLDKYRERSLYETLANLGQVFITSAREGLPLSLMANHISINQGHIEQ